MPVSRKGIKRAHSKEARVRRLARGRNTHTSTKRVTGSREIILVTVAEKPENQMTSFEKMELIEAGISKNDLENLKESAGLDYEKLGKMLSVTRATLINKKGKAKFNSALSEKIVALADIYSYGYDVFEDKDKFNRWIFKANSALGGKRPFDLLNNTFGREEVRHVIGRIDYGVYS